MPVHDFGRDFRAVIIAFSKKFVFVHIHKCAGLSVEKHVAPYLKPWDILIGSGQSGLKRLPSILARRLVGLSKHSSAAEVRLALGARRYDAFTSCAIVRHPEDRIVSLYRYSIKIARKTYQIPSYDPFEKAVEAFWQARDLSIEDAKTLSRIDRRNYLRPVSGIGDAHKWSAIDALMSSRSFDDFVLHPSLKLDPAYQSQVSRLRDMESGKQIVSHVLRQDRLDSDWPILARRIDVPEVLPRHNSSGKVERPTISAAARSEIEATFRDDYDAFSFELR